MDASLSDEGCLEPKIEQLIKNIFYNKDQKYCQMGILNM